MRLPATWRQLAADQRKARKQQARMRTAVRVRALRRGAGPLAPQLDPLESARLAGLRYVNDETTPGIRRIGHKVRVRYVLPNGRTLADRNEIQRIKSLGIP